MKLSEEEKKQLLEENKIEKNGSITLKHQKRGSMLWPSTGNGIVVKAEENTDKLKVSFLQMVDRVVNAKPMRTERRGVTRLFECNLGLIRAKRTWLLYKAGRKQDGDFAYPGLPSRLFGAKVSVSETCKPGNGGKAVECNLKVTDGSDLKDWWI